jgi:hypothetical protein
MLDAGCWIKAKDDTGYWILDAGCWIKAKDDTGYWMLDKSKR